MFQSEKVRHRQWILGSQMFDKAMTNSKTWTPHKKKQRTVSPKERASGGHVFSSNALPHGPGRIEPLLRCERPTGYRREQFAWFDQCRQKKHWYACFAYSHPF